jgi:hypothetical protein
LESARSTNGHALPGIHGSWIAPGYGRYAQARCRSKRTHTSQAEQKLGARAVVMRRDDVFVNGNDGISRFKPLK